MSALLELKSVRVEFAARAACSAKARGSSPSMTQASPSGAARSWR